MNSQNYQQAPLSTKEMVFANLLFSAVKPGSSSSADRLPRLAIGYSHPRLISRRNGKARWGQQGLTCFLAVLLSFGTVVINSLPGRKNMVRAQSLGRSKRTT